MCLEIIAVCFVFLPFFFFFFFFFFKFQSGHILVQQQTVPGRGCRFKGPIIECYNKTLHTFPATSSMGTVTIDT